jgi:hypothetical protein
LGLTPDDGCTEAEAGAIVDEPSRACTLARPSVNAATDNTTSKMTTAARRGTVFQALALGA